MISTESFLCVIRKSDRGNNYSYVASRTDCSLGSDVVNVVQVQSLIVILK